MDTCRRGTLSVTPAVLMCGTEASLSPRTGAVCAAFEIADCGKDQRLLCCPAPPQSLQPPNEYWHLWSLQCGMKDVALTALLAVTQKARHHIPTTSRPSDKGGKMLWFTLKDQICFDLFYSAQMYWFAAFPHLTQLSLAAIPTTAAPKRAMRTFQGHHKIFILFIDV